MLEGFDASGIVDSEKLVKWPANSFATYIPKGDIDG
jgi:hypothetical protein